MNGDVTVNMNAPIDVVWELVSDITRIGEFSPETFEAEWLDGATGPAVGNRFRGHVKRNQKGPIYWSECVVTECEPEHIFGFAVVMKGKTLNNWRYELEPDGDATSVTESFQLEPTFANKIYWATLGKLRGKTNIDGMRTTLERIKAVVEAAPAT